MLSESVSFIDAVASTMRAMLYAAGAAPLILAVAVDERFTELPPKSRRKKSGRLICCFTEMEFEPPGP